MYTRSVEVGGARVVALVGDLTRQDVDAIVNAANTRLEHGGGVAAAIARAGGEVITRESREYVASHGPLEVNEAAVTSGGDLPARLVIHVAGPVHAEHPPGESERRLRSAVRAALDAAAEHEVRSLALPAISAGIYGYPRDEATAVIASTVTTWLREHPDLLDEVRLVGLDAATADDFASGLSSSS